MSISTIAASTIKILSVRASEEQKRKATYLGKCNVGEERKSLGRPHGGAGFLSEGECNGVLF